MKSSTLPVSFGEILSRVIDSGAIEATTLEVYRRDVIYGCLSRDHGVYLVDRGQLKETVPSRDGKECLLAIYTAGDVFGELSLAGVGRSQTETVTAMTHATLRRMHAPQVLAAMSDVGFREEFVRYMAGRLLEQQRMITGLVTEDSEYRLAAVLLDLGHKLGKREAHLLRIQERITQEEFSAMVGTTRSRIGYFLKRFRSAGMVYRARDAFMIVHEDRLRNFIADGYPAVAFAADFDE